MSVFDVRTDTASSVSQLKFAGEDSVFVLATCVTQHRTMEDGKLIRISEGDGDEHDDYVLIGSAEDATNLIKALRKAIDLGWVE